jgi:pilus assembly protein Flp/PilA
MSVALGIYMLGNEYGPCPPAMELHSEETAMQMTFVLTLLAHLRRDEEGQGLVEYLLILALVTFAASAGMTKLASGLNSAFSAIASIVGSYI